MSTTGANGKALVGPVPDGKLIATVEHHERIQRTDLPVPSENADGNRIGLVVELERGATLAGRVVIDPGGEAAALAEVTVTDKAEQKHFGRCNEAGEFSFCDLTPGMVDVRVTRYGGSGNYHHEVVRVVTGTRDLVLRLLGVPPPGQRDPRDRPAPPEGFSGVVLDPAGQPVRGARVYCRPAHAPAGDPSWGSLTWTDHEGRFMCWHNGREPQVVTVVGPPHLFLRDPIHVGQEGWSGEIRLQTAAAPRVTVLDPDGDPVPLVAVELLASNRDLKPLDCLVTDVSGRVRFGGLDPEREFRLSLYLPDGRADLCGATIENWSPADVTICLKPWR